MNLDRRTLIAGLAASTVLTGCSGKEVGASDEAIAAVAYRDPGPTRITLYTMVSTQNDEGLHSGLLISASQQVLFDPAGSWYHQSLPERGDVIFGMIPQAVEFYEDFHARETVKVTIQEVEVSPEVAEMALALARANGPVGPSFCASSISNLLSQVPGFEAVKPTMFPKKLREYFAQVPGVKTRVRWDVDPDTHKELLGRQGDL
ncbi:hypothetical protein PSA7680_03331 [Pseudoruegeria aquimaris]|uniref:Lipoprotein n=1 Tax=Pseudoruegeria aquimaris TaxID=393663 RepID=A0A1Y5TJ13_9RHOB|nr:hypothetical protein [Pseudoruegeria aquimaris]SLN63060.1 hypothetical protein PSA7680_03331 [Pseudoruegeria aquimaris]